jgi:GcrA cell cycle regulator
MVEKRWTEDDVKELKRLRAEGLGPTAIGIRMDRSKNSVDHKLRTINSALRLQAPVATPISTPIIQPAKKAVPTCQWPIGTPKQPGFRFCESTAKTGKPYCQKHYDMAYTPVRWTA